MEDEKYLEWFQRQPTPYVNKVLGDGYSKGRMQEKNGIVNFPGLIAEVPNGKVKKVLLIDPPWVIENKKNLWKKVGSCLPSLGIAYIAAVLENDGHSVTILDCTAEKISVDEFKDKVKDYKHFDYIGITATTSLISNAIRITQILENQFKDAKIVMGGVHPSVLPEETLKNRSVDFVVRGEGENTFKELINNKELSTIDGLSYKDKDGKILHNKDRELIKNLDEIPIPAYHLLPMDKYYPAIGNYKRLPAMSIFATRGCPGMCTFCHKTFGNKVRPRSARSIINEIKVLQRDYGIKEISFYDDTFTLFKKNIKEFCRILIDEKIDITWSCFTRVDYVDEDLLKIMKKSGCHLILFGVESSDEKILKSINKNISLKQVMLVVEMTKRIGIETRASFMFGNPGETVETMKKTIEFSKKLDTDTVQFNITTAYPGTQMYAWAKSNNYLSLNSWEQYNVNDVMMNLPTVTQEEVLKYYGLAHKSFYLRPKIILRRLLRIRTLTQLKQEVAGAIAVITS